MYSQLQTKPSSPFQTIPVYCTACQFLQDAKQKPYCIVVAATDRLHVLYRTIRSCTVFPLVRTSVVDPNTVHRIWIRFRRRILNYGPILDMDQDPGLHMLSIMKKIVLNLSHFASNLSNLSGSIFEMQIHEVAKFGSNLDPDPQHWSALYCTESSSIYICMPGMVNFPPQLFERVLQST